MKARLCLIFAGLIFFALPNFNLLDIMPDFIGAALIMAGLSKMYMYDGNFEDARRGAKFLLWISLLRLVLCVWATSGGRRDYLVPFTFVVCVLEAIYMISLFKGLYLGLEYTLMRADCERHVKRVHEAFSMSFIFVIASRILEFAPQICEIYAQDAELDLSAGASFKMSMAQMKMYVSGACLVCGLILGIIFIAVTANSWIRIIADKSYARFLKDKYDAYLADFREEYVSSRLSTVYLLLGVSFVFFFDVFIDGVNFVPSVIGILLLCAACFNLKRLSGEGKAYLIATCFLAVICSAACYYYMTRVHLGINYIYSLDTYNYSEFPFIEKTGSVYVAAILAFSEFALTAVLVFMCIGTMIRFFAKERRTVAIPMLKLLCVPSCLTLISSALVKVFKTLEGHLASNPEVRGYVQNKAYITSKADYLGYMENPLISGYEKISSVSYVLTFVTVLLAFVCVLYLIRIHRFTEGDYDGKK